MATELEVVYSKGDGDSGSNKAELSDDFWELQNFDGNKYGPFPTVAESVAMVREVLSEKGGITFGQRGRFFHVRERAVVSFSVITPTD